MSIGVHLGRETVMLKARCLHSFIRWNFQDDIRSEAVLAMRSHPMSPDIVNPTDNIVATGVRNESDASFSGGISGRL
jgi:hypothetical protein